MVRESGGVVNLRLRLTRLHAIEVSSFIRRPEIETVDRLGGLYESALRILYHHTTEPRQVHRMTFLRKQPHVARVFPLE